MNAVTDMSGTGGAAEMAFAALLDALRAGDPAPLESRFTSLGLAAPRVVWNPGTQALPDPTLRDVRAHWDRLRGTREMPDWRDLRAEELGAAVVHLSIVDPVPGETDYRFAVYGSAVARAARRDYRGETVREMAERTATPGPVLYRAVYALVAERGIPAYSWSVAPPWQPVESWHRLVLPFIFGEDGAGADRRFLVCMKSEGRRRVAPETARAGEIRLGATR